MKKAGKIQTWIIIILSFAYTAYAALNILILITFNKFSKKREMNNALKWADRLFKLISLKYKIINPFNITPKKGTPTIIMCNHTSLYDIPLSFKTFNQHRIRMLTKKELLNVPILGFAIKKAGFPFIDRKNPSQAIKDLQKVRELLQQGIIIWIAPEGTRSKSGKLNKFKKGGFITAIETGATIIPIGIRNAHKILPSGLFEIFLGCNVEIHVGKPVDTTKYTLENKEKLIKKVYDSIHSLVNPD